MKRILISLFAAVALISCAKELPQDQSADQVKVQPGQLVQFTTSFADAAPQARVTLDHQTGKLSWSEGDQVAVVLTDGTNLSYDDATYTVDHQTGILEIPENSAYVIYPASQKGTLSGTTLTLSLPSTHSVNTPEDAFDNALMKGVVNGTKVEFKNLLGFFKVPVTGEGKLKSAVLRTICRTTTEFHPISNAATLDLSKDATTAAGGIKMATGNTAFSWVRYNFSGEVDLSAAGQAVYFAVPAGEYQNMGIVLVTEGGSNAIYATAAHTAERSKVKPVSSSAINLANHTPVSAVSLTGTTGNPQEDYANCYMVPPTAGSYEFDCKLADGTVLKNGVTAEIKWAEKAGLVKDLYYDKAANKISFKTNGQEGNALVVLTDNTDKEATNVWLWHIWITDTPKVLHIESTGNANQYYVMDRVLGATWAPESTIAQTATVTWSGNTAPVTTAISSADASDACGVYFQYQNRIPFPRIVNIDYTPTEDISTLRNTRCDVMYGFTQYGQFWSSSASCGKVLTDGNGQYVYNNFRYPNYEYNNNNSWINANVINNSNTSTTDPSVKLSDTEYAFWIASTKLTYTDMMKCKTTHDPCPPGYMLETHSDMYWYAHTRANTAGFARAAADNAAYEAGYRFYGIYFNVAKTAENKDVALYFPCAGNRYKGYTDLAATYGNMGYIYAVNTSKERTETYTVGDYKIGDASSFQYGATTSGKTIGWSTQNSKKVVNSQAYNVRCRRGKF